MILECTDCHNDFVLRKEEQLWLWKRHLEMKKRCPVCLQRRRWEKEKAAQTAASIDKGGDSQ
jgi:hypothetical protein